MVIFNCAISSASNKLLPLGSMKLTVELKSGGIKATPTLDGLIVGAFSVE